MLPQLQSVINRAKTHNPFVDTIQIQIANYGDSYKVQEVLFNNGIYWLEGSTPNFIVANAKFLYISLNYSSMFITYSMSTRANRGRNYYTITSTDILQNIALKRIH
mgnify:CR=1 FL=1